MTATFVLVHGAFCNSAVWSPTVLTLRGHRAMAVDLPGHGLAATIPRSWSTSWTAAHRDH